MVSLFTSRFLSNEMECVVYQVHLLIAPLKLSAESFLTIVTLQHLRELRTTRILASWSSFHFWKKVPSRWISRDGHVTKTLSFTISDLPIVILEQSLTVPDQYKVCGTDLGSRSTLTDLTQLCTDRRCCEG